LKVLKQTPGRNAAATPGRTFSQITDRRVDFIPFGRHVILVRFTRDRDIKYCLLVKIAPKVRDA